MDLPSEMLSEVLCNWLELKALVQLDSAMCNHQSRSTLLGLFSSRLCIFDSTVVFESAQIVKWFRSKKLQVSSIRIGDLYPEMANYFRLHSASIRHVECQSSRSLSIVAIHVRNLVALIYQKSTAVSELSDIIWVNSHLKELRLEGISQFNIENLHELSLPHLLILSLWVTPCNDVLLSMLVRTTAVLKKIEIGHCELVTDKGAIAIAQHCPQLRSLGLCALPISDGAVMRITKLCPSIRSLDLTSNRMITDIGVRAIAENLKHLRCLSVSKCTRLSDVSIQHLTQYSASKLQVLHAVKLRSVRVDVLIALLRNCPHLRTLSLDCDLETYHADIIPHMCNLQTLVLRNPVSDDALCMIAQHCKKLQELAIFSDRVYKAPTPATNAQSDVIPARVMHGPNGSLKFEDRKYTAKGLLALTDGLPQLQVLGVKEKELEQGLLTPLAQGVWRRLRPNMRFETHLGFFAFDALTE